MNKSFDFPDIYMNASFLSICGQRNTHMSIKLISKFLIEHIWYILFSPTSIGYSSVDKIWGPLEDIFLALCTEPAALKTMYATLNPWKKYFKKSFLRLFNTKLDQHWTKAKDSNYLDIWNPGKIRIKHFFCFSRCGLLVEINFLNTTTCWE